ncbi:endonuclease/exonuclease/phosphatase family protein [Streptomyces sp. ME02-6991-2A]|uniref:endonuclease/exonuclease/phosphatase family protein n=1 Tax=Streptomyces sp. ME02-6991-2A TaxID=3028677 RepID=UPI0010084F62|nr:endonuclease/exonuclease/phosphatase family protein [Streptomyces sp. ME02-6991-2A]MDX3373104.1 endonuclease/exonuclease/phosphatase family protein [Streptomyces sp. ME02-6991-2A]
MRATVRGVALTGAALVAVVVAAGAWGLSSGGTDTPPAGPPKTLRIITWNICGEAGGERGQSGYCPLRDRPEKKAEKIAALARERDADVITLQEVCGGAPGSHVALLRSALGPGWSVRHAEGARPDGETRCRDGLSGDLGVAVAVRGEIVRARSQNALPRDPAGVSRQTLPVLCVRVSGWPYTPCTTHILPGEEPRVREQVAAVREFVRGEDRPAVLTGDFNRNSGAPQLDPLVSSFSVCPGTDEKGRGAVTYHGWDPEKRAHTFHELDHIFFDSPPGVKDPLVDCGVVTELMDTTPNEPGGPGPDGYSDHAPVYADLRTGS